VLIHSLTPEVTGEAELLSVRMLGSDEEIICQRQPDGLRLTFPTQKPCDFAYTFRLSFDRPIGQSLPSEAVNVVMKHGE